MSDDDAVFDLNKLPKGVQSLVFAHFDAQSLAAAACVSRAFLAEASAAPLWHRHLRQRDGITVVERAVYERGLKCAFLESRRLGHVYPTLADALNSIPSNVTGQIEEIERLLGDDDPALVPLRERLEAILTSARAKQQAMQGRSFDVVVLLPGDLYVLDARMSLSNRGRVELVGLEPARAARVSIAQGAFVDASDNTSLTLDNLSIDRHNDTVEKPGTENRISFAVGSKGSLTMRNCSMAASPFGTGVAIFQGPAMCTLIDSSFTDGQHAVVAVASCALSITNCHFEKIDTALYGKAEGMQMVVTDCKFVNCKNGGVSTRQAETCNVTNSSFSGCVTQSCILNRITNACVERCVFSHSPTATAIMVRGCDACEVRDCSINSCIVGVSVDQCEDQMEDSKAIRLSYCHVSGCSISNAGAVGISAGSGGTLVVSNSNIQRCKAAVELHTERECSLSNVIMTKNPNGLLAYEDSKCLLAACVMEECSEHPCLAKQGAVLVATAPSQMASLEVLKSEGAPDPEWVAPFVAATGVASVQIRAVEARVVISKSAMTPEERGALIVKESLRLKKCTRFMTGSDFVPQPGFECFSCEVTFQRGMALCIQCVRTCHRDKAHRVSSEPTTGSMFCDCTECHE